MNPPPPHPPNAHPPLQVAIGGWHALAVDESGQLWSWGGNEYFQASRRGEGPHSTAQHSAGRAVLSPGWQGGRSSERAVQGRKGCWQEMPGRLEWQIWQQTLLRTSGHAIAVHHGSPDWASDVPSKHARFAVAEGVYAHTISTPHPAHCRSHHFNAAPALLQCGVNMGLRDVPIPTKCLQELRVQQVGG